MRAFWHIPILILLGACQSTMDPSRKESEEIAAVEEGKPLPEDCKSGRGCNKLGTLANERKEPQRELQFFKKGCRLGHDDSCVEVARIAALNGQSGKAARILKDACEAHRNGYGCLHWAVLEDRLGNRRKAGNLARQSCDYGDGLGCQLMLTFLKDADVKERFSYLGKARNIYSKACESGDDSGCEFLVQLTAVEELERLNATITYLDARCKKDGAPFCSKHNYLKFLSLTCERQLSAEATECAVLFDQVEDLFAEYYPELNKEVFAH